MSKCYASRAPWRKPPWGQDSWEGQLGRIIPNSNGVSGDLKHNYTSVTHQNFALYYRPEDTYIVMDEAAKDNDAGQ